MEAGTDTGDAGGREALLEDGDHLADQLADRDARGSGGVVAVANRTRWFVGADEDDAGIGDLDADGAHRRRVDVLVEQAAT